MKYKNDFRREAMSVKVGIIGCGGIAEEKHLPALSQIEEVELVAFVILK